MPASRWDMGFPGITACPRLQWDNGCFRRWTLWHCTHWDTVPTHQGPIPKSPEAFQQWPGGCGNSRLVSYSVLCFNSFEVGGVDTQWVVLIPANIWACLAAVSAATAGNSSVTMCSQCTVLWRWSYLEERSIQIDRTGSQAKNALQITTESWQIPACNFKSRPVLLANWGIHFNFLLCLPCWQQSCLISKSAVDAGWARTAVSLDFGRLCFSKSLSDQLSQRLLYNFVLLFHLASQKRRKGTVLSLWERRLMNQSKQWYPLSLIRERRPKGGGINF